MYIYWPDALFTYLDKNVVYIAQYKIQSKGMH